MLRSVAESVKDRTSWPNSMKTELLIVAVGMLSTGDKKLKIKAYGILREKRVDTCEAPVRRTPVRHLRPGLSRRPPGVESDAS